jgi:hypothetical protein
MPNFFHPQTPVDNIYAVCGGNMAQMSLATTGRKYHTFQEGEQWSSPSGWFSFSDNPSGEIRILKSGSYLLEVDLLSQVETSFQTINCGVELNGATDLDIESFVDLIIGYNIKDHKMIGIFRADCSLGYQYIRLFAASTNGSASGTYQDAVFSVTKINDDYT